MKFDRNQCDQIPSLTRLNSTASRHSNNNTSYSLVKSNLIKLETGCTVILHPIVSVLLLYLILKNGVAQIVLHISRSFAFDKPAAGNQQQRQAASGSGQEQRQAASISSSNRLARRQQAASKQHQQAASKQHQQAASKQPPGCKAATGRKQASRHMQLESVT